MAKILRGLDMLAGEAGRVMYGENARKEQLLAGVQQRSQQMYLQRQRQDSELNTRLKVQDVSDRASMARTERIQEGQTKRELIAKNAGKYDKGRWGYLQRTLKLDPKFTALYDFSESRLKELDDILSGPNYDFMDDKTKKNVQDERLYFNLMFDELNKKIIPGIQDRVTKRFFNQGKPELFGERPTFTPKPGGATNADNQLNKDDPFGIL